MLLELDHITKFFDGLCVLSDVSFHLGEREIVGLIGPNGAGKTTLFNIITGIHTPDAGSIRFQDKEMSGEKPYRICRSGIARTFQLVRIFPTLTVLDNVLIGSIYGNKKKGKKIPEEKALQSLELLDLTAKNNLLSGQLTLGDRRLVEIARAIAAEPVLALLDEPLAGMNPSETKKIMEVIRNIRNTLGISILWIEHKVDAIFNVCDRVVVLDYGKKIAEGDPRETANNPKVVEAYLGEPLT